MVDSITAERLLADEPDETTLDVYSTVEWLRTTEASHAQMLGYHHDALQLMLAHLRR